MADFYSKVIDHNFFEKYYNIKTQQDIEDLVKRLNLTSPQLIIYIYDDFIYKNKDIEGFLLLNQPFLNKIMRDFMILNFKIDVDEKIVDNCFDKIKEDINNKIDYLEEIDKVKKQMKFYEYYKKLINDVNTYKTIIETVNQKIEEHEKVLLSEIVLNTYLEIKKPYETNNE